MMMRLGEQLLHRYRMHLLKREAREAANHLVEVWKRKNGIEWLEI